MIRLIDAHDCFDGLVARAKEMGAISDAEIDGMTDEIAASRAESISALDTGHGLEAAQAVEDRLADTLRATLRKAEGRLASEGASHEVRVLEEWYAARPWEAGNAEKAEPKAGDALSLDQDGSGPHPVLGGRVTLQGAPRPPPHGRVRRSTDAEMPFGALSITNYYALGELSITTY